MIEFAVTVQGQRISCTKVKGELVSGAKGVKVRFTWSEEWQQLQRIGVFRAGSIARDVMDLQDECVIPWEVLVQPGQVLMIGVQGVNEEGTVVTPTLEAEMDEILRGADPSDDPSTEPTLPIWQWVKNLLEQAVHLMTKAVLFTKQVLTPSEKAQARENIGAADAAFVGDSAAALDAIIEMQEALLNASGTLPDDYGTPYAVEYISQELTEVAKTQARKNIDAASVTDLQQLGENAEQYANQCFHPTGQWLYTSEGTAPEGVFILDLVTANGGYRFTEPLIINGVECSHLLHFNTLEDAGGLCAFQIGLSYNVTENFVVRWRWYHSWSEWKTL